MSGADLTSANTKLDESSRMWDSPLATSKDAYAATMTAIEACGELCTKESMQYECEFAIVSGPHLLPKELLPATVWRLCVAMKHLSIQPLSSYLPSSKHLHLKTE
jgi:hypothetical protein